MWSSRMIGAVAALAAAAILGVTVPDATPPARSKHDEAPVSTDRGEAGPVEFADRERAAVSGAALVYEFVERDSDECFDDADASRERSRRGRLLVQHLTSGVAALRVEDLEADADDPLHRASASSCSIELDDDGVIRGYRFAATLGSAERNAVRSLVGRLLLRRPTGLGSRPIRHVDPNGEFTGQLEVRATDDDTLTVLREHDSYTELVGWFDESASHAVCGTTRATVAADGTVREEIVEHALELCREGAALARIGSRVSIRRAGAAASFAGPDLLVGLTPAGPELETTVAEDRDADLLAGTTADGALQDLIRLGRTAKFGSRELATAWLRLARWLERDPALAARLGATIRSVEAEADVAGLLLTALGAAGTVEAQRELVDVLADPGRPEISRRGALTALFQVAAPELTVVAAVAGTARTALCSDDASRTALLLLGAFVRGGGSGEVGQQARSELLSLEAVAAARGETASWLQGLGNAGSADALPRVLPHVRCSDPEVRAAATFALRVADDATALPLLAEQLVDETRMVRSEAVHELARRGSEGAVELLGRAAQDPEPAMRRLALDGLGIVDSETATMALRRAAEADPDPDVREHARGILAERSGRRGRA
ncbi:MAG: HEAT repeat domain-containing protein [Planctomycetes bacterium]|nr:HEAT repeat domain-containing protein [Planctomycetota bacterium]